MRVGQGYDAHKTDPRRPLIIGGVKVADRDGLAGHSDADVLSHAIADALLGAAGLGDLGSHFPDSERWRDASSLDILAACAALLDERGSSIVNIDSTVIAEVPRLAPYRERMIDRVAGALGIAPDLVSIKFTSTDGTGSTGRSEGIAASAVVLVTP